MKKPRYSPSRLGMLARCGIQYQYRYLDGIIEPPAAAPLAGRAVHSGIETNLRHRQHEGTEAPEEMIAERVVDRLRDEFETAEEEHGGLALNDDENELGAERVRGILVDRSIALAQLHRAAVAPELTLIEPYERDGKAVTGIEQSLSIDAGAFDVMVVLDVMTADHELRDTKTKVRTVGQTRSPTVPAGAAERNMQLATQDLVYRGFTGQTPKRIALDFLVDLAPETRKGQGKVSRDPVVRALSRPPHTGAELQVLLNRYQKLHEVAESGIFTPADPGAWCCSERWCGYWHRCPYGSGNRTQVQVSPPDQGATDG